MFRTTFLPLEEMKIHPAFWGFKRDFFQEKYEMDNLLEGSKSNFMNFKETDKAYLFSIDFPGVSKSDLGIEIENDKILISGTRKSSFSETLKDQEISRVVNVPKFVDKNKIQAYHENGVLYISLPKLEKPKARKIKISDGIKESSWKNLLGFEKKDNKITVS